MSRKIYTKFIFLFDDFSLAYDLHIYHNPMYLTVHRRRIGKHGGNQKMENKVTIEMLLDLKEIIEAHNLHRS